MNLHDSEVVWKKRLLVQQAKQWGHGRDEKSFFCHGVGRVKIRSIGCPPIASVKARKKLKPVTMEKREIRARALARI